MKIGIGFFGSLFLILAVLGGCAPTPSSRAYNTDQMFNEQSVHFGRILSMRPVEFAERINYVGTVAGALVGSSLLGYLASSMGLFGHIIGDALGAVAGGVAGHELQKNATVQQGVEVTVRLSSGKIIAVLQKKDPQLVVNQKVRVLSQADGTARIIPFRK